MRRFLHVVALFALIASAVVNGSSPVVAAQDLPDGFGGERRERAFEVWVRNGEINADVGESSEGGRGGGSNQIQQPNPSPGDSAGENLPPTQSSDGESPGINWRSAFYCMEEQRINPLCQAMVPVPCVLSAGFGGVNTGNESLNYLSMCGAGTGLMFIELPSSGDGPGPEPPVLPAVDEEEPEASLPPEQLVYTQVVEEFSQLPIDGGSVEFEEALLGFGYVNRHTNVYADVESQVLQREMLGFQVEIRAVPVRYTFDYGDGTTRTTTTTGAALAGEQALTDTQTPTSHVYTDTGVYTVSLTTTFNGEFRVTDSDTGTTSGWVAIPGTATVSGAPGDADIWRSSSRLVSGPCRGQSHFGCNGPVELEEGDQPPAIFADQYDHNGNWVGQ
ncbi:hypothetical protein GCM10009771_19700 [Nesterenkonia flava]